MIIATSGEHSNLRRTQSCRSISGGRSARVCTGLYLLFAAACYVHDWPHSRQIKFIGSLGAVDVALLIVLAGFLHWI